MEKKIRRMTNYKFINRETDFIYLNSPLINSGNYSCQSANPYTIFVFVALFQFLYLFNYTKIFHKINGNEL